jgi:hypothetical protein
MLISTPAERAVISAATDFASGWDQFSPESKRQFVELITDKIVVGKAEVAANLAYVPTAVETGGKATQPQEFISAVA